MVPMFDKATPPPKQGELLGQMISLMPPDLLQKAVKWIVRSNTPEDRADYASLVKMGAPAERFPIMKGWIKEALSEEDWKDLQARIPDF
ncbi:MAG: hypothetical protein ACE5OZ_25590 [Candidatus Heimdallarchaeota archaeon]